MSRVVLFVALLTLAVLVAVWFANNPGEVTVIWHDWRIDTSVGILLALMAVIVAVMLLIAKLVAMIRGTALGFAAARRERRMAQGLRALGHGFAAARGGQGVAARRYAKEAAALLDDNAATRVLAAQAAQVNDDAATLRSVAVNLLDKPETELAALRDLAERARAEGDVVGALNYAARALARKDAPKWALDVVLDVQIGAARWTEALSTLESRPAREHYTAAALKTLKAELLTNAAEAALAHRDAAQANTLARRALDQGAGPRAVIAHARALALQGKHKKAAAEIERIWTAKPDAALAAAYIEILATEPALERARRVEKLVAESADDPESRLMLAEASLRAQLWGQARNRLAPLLGDDVPRELHARAAILMAELETGERNDPAAGATWLKRALERAPQAVATPPPRSVSELLGAVR